MTAPEQPDETEQTDEPELDLAGAIAQGVAGGIANGTMVGAIGTALRDLAVQQMAHRAAAALAEELAAQHSTDDAP